MNHKQFLFLIPVLVCTLLIASLHNSTSVLAQEVDISWTPPSRVPGFIDSDLNPVILADPEGAIHLFNSQLVDEEPRIFYIRWTLNEGWSTLVDIITSPQGGARIYGAHLDEQGWIHLIFFGGNDLGANIYYTKAPINNAGKTTAWSSPKLIGESAITPSMAAMVSDGRGYMTVVYSGNINGNGIYTVQSLDGGNTWSSPRTMFVTYSNNLWPYAFDLYIDDENSIYAAWSVVNDIGLGEAIYFSRYEQSTMKWSLPKLIAEAIGYEVNTPTIIKFHGKLILVYHNAQPTTHWMRSSSDAGETWSSPIRLFRQVGGNGPVSIVMDSNENLHMLFGNRIGDPATHGVWHSRLLDDRWTIPEAIVSGPQILVGLNGEEGFDPSFVQAVISRGNLLFVIWRHDPMAGPTNIWYSYQTLDAPELAPIPLKIITEPTPPTPVDAAIIGPDATTELSAPTPVLEPLSPSTPEQRIESNDPISSIFLGVFAVGLLFLIAIVTQKRLK